MKISKNIFSKQLYDDRYSFLIHHYQKGKILDIGNVGGICGIGKSNSSHLKFKSAVLDDSKVYGLDLFEPPIELNKLFDNQTKADIEKGIPFESNFFDTIYMGQVLEHMRNPSFVISQVHRCLKDNGIFILDVPNTYSLFRLLKYIFIKSEDLGDPTHISFLSPASLITTIDICGFNVKELATDWKQKCNWLPYNFKKGLGSHLLIAATKK